jgi:hypothetical protein
MASENARNGLSKYFHDSFVEELLENSEYGLEYIKKLFNYNDEASWRQFGFQFEWDLMQVINLATNNAG